IYGESSGERTHREASNPDPEIPVRIPRARQAFDLGRRPRFAEEGTLRPRAAVSRPHHPRFTDPTRGRQAVGRLCESPTPGADDLAQRRLLGAGPPGLEGAT